MVGISGKGFGILENYSFHISQRHGLRGFREGFLSLINSHT